MTASVETDAITRELAAYIAGARDRELPPEVAEKAKHHLLDTLAAMVSGSRLPPGAIAAAYVRAQGGVEEALVVGSEHLTTAVNAAFANGMLAHADETDDSHAPSFTHPGCAVVPAALAMAERDGRSGEALLRAVVLGYDVCARTTPALGREATWARGFSTHSLGGLFGAAAAAGSLAGLDAEQARSLLAYTAQQASGLHCWVRDTEHVEKAFDFGGMTARNAVAAATMVAFGFSGVEDALTGEAGFLQAFGFEPDPDALVRDLGERYEILHANIKKWPVGSPIQAALDSILALRAEHGLEADAVERIVVRLPEREARIVDGRTMPNISLQYLVAVALVDGTVTFAAAHDYERPSDPAVAALMRRIELVPDVELGHELPRRQAIVEVTTSDGRAHRHRTSAVRGTSDSPMDRAEVEAKARDLLAPVLGAERAATLIEHVWRIEDLASARELRPLLRA